MTSVTDPAGNTTTYGVDDEFLVTKVTTASPFSYETKYSYNGNRKLVKVELENRNDDQQSRDASNPWWETRSIFSDAGLLLTKRRELSETGGTVTWIDTKYTYDDDFRLTKSIDPMGYATLLTLDERGLTTKVEVGYGSTPDTVEYTYDVDGLLVTTTRKFRNVGDASDTEVVSRREYDVFDRVTKTYDGANDATADNTSETSYSRTIKMLGLPSQRLTPVRSSSQERPQRRRMQNELSVPSQGKQASSLQPQQDQTSSQSSQPMALVLSPNQQTLVRPS